MKKIMVSIILLFSIAVSTFSYSEEIINTSIINLIATPEKYHGKKVLFIGFAVMRFEETGIYLSKDDAERRILKNSIWLSNTTKMKVLNNIRYL